MKKRTFALLHSLINITKKFKYINIRKPGKSGNVNPSLSLTLKECTATIKGNVFC